MAKLVSQCSEAVREELKNQNVHGIFILVLLYLYFGPFGTLCNWGTWVPSSLRENSMKIHIKLMNNKKYILK